MPASGDPSLPRTYPAFRDAARTCSSNAEVPVSANARPTRAAAVLKLLFYKVAILLLAAVVYAGWIVARTWHRISV